LTFEFTESSFSLVGFWSLEITFLPPLLRLIETSQDELTSWKTDSRRKMMKPSFAVCMLIAFVALVSNCFADTAYIVTDNDNYTGNSSTIYALDTVTGELTHLADLSTGPGIGWGGGYFATVGTSAVVTGAQGCLLVYDSGSSDIATFKINLSNLDVTFVGNFSNTSALISQYSSSLAVAPNGGYVYATYYYTENIGAWKINTDCSLNFIAAYTASVGADQYDGIKVTPDSAHLLVASPNYGAVEEFAIDELTGELTDLGYANFAALTDCIKYSCYPAGIDITGDGLAAIIGNYSDNAPSVLAAEITPKGLKYPTYFPLAHTGSLTPNANVPFLSAAAYKGSGPLYVGMSGTCATGSQPGVVTATLSEASKTIVGKAATAISNAPGLCDGLIASTGNWMVVSEWFNTLQVFKINANGTLTPTAQGPVPNDLANGAYSFFIYPNTR
jgi:hypothetical protein